MYTASTENFGGGDFTFYLCLALWFWFALGFKWKVACILSLIGLLKVGNEHS